METLPCRLRLSYTNNIPIYDLRATDIIQTCDRVVCSGSERSSRTVSSSKVGGARGDLMRLTARGFVLTGDSLTTDSSPRSNSQFRRLARSLGKKYDW